MPHRVSPHLCCSSSVAQADPCPHCTSQAEYPPHPATHDLPPAPSAAWASPQGSTPHVQPPTSLSSQMASSHLMSSAPSADPSLPSALPTPAKGTAMLRPLSCPVLFSPLSACHQSWPSPTQELWLVQEGPWAGHPEIFCHLGGATILSWLSLSGYSSKPCLTSVCTSVKRGCVHPHKTAPTLGHQNHQGMMPEAAPIRGCSGAWGLGASASSL